MGMNIWFTEMTKGQWLGEGWSYKDGRAYTLVLNFFMINNIGLTPGGSSWNAPAWSISVEFWVNIIIAAAALISRKKIIYVAAAAFFATYWIMFHNVASLSEYAQNVYGWLNAGMLRGMLGMTAGMLCYAAYKVLAPKVMNKGVLLAVVAVAMVAVQFWMVGGGLKVKHADFLIVPVSMLTVLAVALAETQKKQFKFDNVLEWLGECSYSIYMIHWIVLVFINYFMIYHWKMQVDVKDPLTFTAMTLLVLVMARLSFNYIEKPGKNLIKGFRK
jgi:peptidoglycan/LPS O-acetylase OafA/YrhL